MSEFSGTPGPWLIDRYGKVVDGRGMTLGVSGVALPRTHNTEYVANAHLVSAAPELLEALISAKKELEEYEQEVTGEEYNNPAINSAINKALGR